MTPINPNASSPSIFTPIWAEFCANLPSLGLGDGQGEPSRRLLPESVKMECRERRYNPQNIDKAIDMRWHDVSTDAAVERYQIQAHTAKTTTSQSFKGCIR